MHPQIQEFFRLFEGNATAYGSYIIVPDPKKKGKQVGKAASINRPVCLELYNNHLMGIEGLGITPINKDSNARFGAIDIDEYPLDLEALNKKVRDMKLPITICRTKSGGAHLYLFLKDWAPAGLVQKKLRQIAAVLGYGSCEIYPRQAQLLASRGDIGNWINLPYYHAEKTTRYAIDDTGRALSMLGFVTQAYNQMVHPHELEDMDFVVPESLHGGPPCLQTLIKQGFPQGTRNNGLMNLGIYAMKAYGENWQKHLEEYNTKFMTPPLDSKEVLQVMASLKKKDYSYTCKAQPIQSFCNAAVCRTCKFGVGGADLGMPKMGTLTKLTTQPPVWFLDIESETDNGNTRIELSTEELQSPILFRKGVWKQLT